MKYSLIILGCLFVVAQGINQKVVDQIHANMKVLGDKCLAETGASAADFDMIVKKQPLTTHESKCLMHCIFKYLNMIKEDGTFNKAHESESSKLLQEDDSEYFEKLNANFLKCTDSVTVNEDACVTGADLEKCWDEENKKTGVQCVFL